QRARERGAAIDLHGDSGDEGRRGAQQETDHLAAGVIHEAVDAVVLGDDAGDRGLHRVFVADVEGDAVGAAAVLGDLGGHALQLVLRATADDDPRAKRRQLVRDAAPDAAAAAGDPQDPAFEQAGPQHAGVARGRRCIHDDDLGDRVTLTSTPYRIGDYASDLRAGRP